MDSHLFDPAAGPGFRYLGPRRNLNCAVLLKFIPYAATVLIALVALLPAAIGQAAQNPSGATPQFRPASLPHLYGHFLIHQNELDVMAAKLKAEGKADDTLRNDFQTRLGFSDDDFTPIRTSSRRLAAELAPIEAELKALPRNGMSADQAHTLATQRESYINNEVYNLSVELSPQNKARLEQFMTQFFAPKKISIPPPATGSSKGKAVQQ
jgi:hypothetical protein